MNYFNTLLICCLLSVVYSCSEDPQETECCNYDYEMVIESPLPGLTYNQVEDIPVDILFHSRTGEYVHYIEVKIFQAEDSLNVIHNLVSHVHVPDSIRYKATVSIDPDQVPEGVSSWVCRTRAYGHEDNPTVITNRISFQIEN